MCLSESEQVTRTEDCKWHATSILCLLSVGFTDFLGPFTSSHITTRVNRETASLQASQLCITAYTLETDSSGHFWYIGISRMVYVLPLNYAPNNPTFLQTLS